jgi:nucleoside triphosphate pyrophosphatase
VQPRANGRAVLAADTVVVVDGAILGKPVDRDDATRMLRMLSGRSHQVLTAVCLAGGPDPEGGPDEVRPTGTKKVQGGADKVRPTVTKIETTTVEFAPMTDEDIDWYVSSGEPDDKAGAYAIQGLASRFITRISGSYSNVVGLPVSLVFQMFKAVEFRP